MDKAVQQQTSEERPLEPNEVLDRLVARVAEDARSDPEGYLENTRVPEGGE